ncbi:Putative aliphatic sulfonates-binding protein precursor [Gemmata sp. SH-PL17]|uniref:ABC transporter substrate-binding protein n=1 Tax=Gemmata sp. SH-PL17 TaxID=1630693 RepID=UPI0004B2EBFA|nr:ABC transporter substrate-binding protein [Gemmata sp. SH-PL17]AMV26318.1 Putative aliphatic sulfonates-binding protein precursor [Gemmata sp. SH-PL17]
MTSTSARRRPRTRFVVAGLFGAVALALLPVGCGKSGQTGDDPGKIKVAYLGLTCEAPIFVAQEKGMFAEQGVDVEVVRTDWDGLREGLASGQFHANHTLVMYILKGVEKGSDFKITAGVHTGCLRVQVPPNSPIKSVAELKGKRIGVPSNIGSPPAMFASRTLAAVGIDPTVEAKEVTWVAMDPVQLGARLQQGELDAIATSDPIGTILEGNKVVRTIADQAKDQPYADEYCCAVVVNGDFSRKYPAAAAKVTKAILKGAKWVQENPKAAAELGVEKKYITAKVDINTQALMQLKYVPGVAKGKRSVEQAAEDMKKAKLLSASTDPAALAKRAWADLDGVTDEWVTAQAVERIDGARPARLRPDLFAALFDGGKGNCLCCTRCCIE